ncbi:replication-relaxation family protein [Streptomyces sp. 8L]|uniref:replication-relaxation family protein n=1 Tax=Streptomyces sp. 8L TaxID=2877242 RepID=UPI001CD3447B|nr:replication-relaxation family protein [Streptomyces sp. 8L]MCA1222630.1 replication-relaxation family protein [Streptomyces sp. 8L]
MYGTFTTPAKGSLRADAVLTAPEDGMPVLFVEVDRFSEPAAVLSRKIVDYREFFRRRLPDTRDRHVPLWSSQWPAPELVSHPPLALVFAKDVTDTVLQRRIAEVRGNTRDCWGAPWTSYLGLGAPNPREEDGWRQYGDIVPVITTTLAQLQQRGPHGPVWTRFGRSRPEPLTDALTHRNTHEDYMEREERLQAARTPPPGYGDSQHGAPMKDPWTQPEEDPGEDEPPGWECPSCHTPTSTAAPGLDGYAPEPGGRCPRCEQVHRELTQSRTQTGVLARLRARAEGRHPSSPGA